MLRVTSPADESIRMRSARPGYVILETGRGQASAFTGAGPTTRKSGSRVVGAPVARLATNIRAATLTSVVAPVVQALVRRKCHISFILPSPGTKVQKSG